MLKRSRIRTEKGQAMVEFTIVLPVFLLLLLGIAQLGIVWNNYIQVTDAVRAGARKGAVSRTASNPSQATINAVRASAVNLNQGQLVVDPPQTTWAPGSDLKVCAHYPYSINLLGLVVSGGNLNSCTTERVE
jgi:Flp pilus assembly protein TadG